MSAMTVFLSATFVASFQGLGAIPLWLFENLGLSVSSYLIVCASGMMVGTSFLLIGSALEECHSRLEHNININNHSNNHFNNNNNNNHHHHHHDYHHPHDNNNINNINNINNNQMEQWINYYCSMDCLNVYIGLLIGWGLVHLFAYLIQSTPDITFQNIKGKSASQILVVLLTMTIHSLGEGASIGVSYGVSKNNDLSSIVILSLCIHNIPEGLATCLFLVSRGMSKFESALWSMACDIPLPLTAVPAFLFVDYFEKLLEISLGFAAGAMLYVSFMELIPECIQLLQKSQMKQLKDSFIRNESENHNNNNNNNNDNNNSDNTTKKISSIWSGNEAWILTMIFFCSMFFVFLIAD